MMDRLNPEEISQLWIQFKKNGSLEVRDRLITHYLHLVKYVAGRLAIKLPTHVKLEDLYSTGILGLIKAIEKYDLTKKNKFETYAILLIKGAIVDEMRSLDWVPRSVHQKANFINETRTLLEQRLGREATDEEIANKLNISLSEYEELLERIRPVIFIPLNFSKESDNERVCLSERIADKKAKTGAEYADQNEWRKILEKAVKELPQQERNVLCMYYYENLMLKEIGKRIGVTESRISQVHTKAILRLKGRLASVVNDSKS